MNNNDTESSELSSREGTRFEFNGSKAVIKSAEGRIRPVCGLGIDVHQDFYVVVMREGGTNPKPAQRFQKESFLHWVARFKQEGAEVYAVFDACGLALVCSGSSRP